MFCRSLFLSIFFFCCFASYVHAADVIFAISAEAYPPIHSVEEGGECRGFAVDLIRAICREEGITPSFGVIPWATIIPEVSSGKYAAAVAGMTVTAGRKEQVDFSEPYFHSEQTVVIRAHEEIGEEQDLEFKKIGAWGATTNFEECRRIARFNNVNKVFPYPTVEHAMEALLMGQIDAVFTDSPSAMDCVFQNEKFQDKLAIGFVIPAKEPEFFGFPVNKNEKELLSKLNRGLEKLKSSGEYGRIYEKWFHGLKENEKSSSWIERLWN